MDNRLVRRSTKTINFLANTKCGMKTDSSINNTSINMAFLQVNVKAGTRMAKWNHARSLKERSAKKPYGLKAEIYNLKKICIKCGIMANRNTGMKTDTWKFKITMKTVCATANIKNGTKMDKLCEHCSSNTANRFEWSFTCNHCVFFTQFLDGYISSIQINTDSRKYIQCAYSQPK